MTDEIAELRRELFRLKRRVRSLEAYSDMPESLKERTDERGDDD